MIHSLFLALAALAWMSPAAKIRAPIASLYESLQTNSMRFVVDTAGLPDSVRGPNWATGWKLERDGGTRPGGTEAITLVWTGKDSPFPRRDWVQVRVERQELVPVARGRFLSGDAIDSSRLDWQWRRTTGMRVIPPTPDSVGRFRTRTGISPGQAIWRNQLELRPVFHKGDLVKVQAGNQGAFASIDAVALEDGFAGSKTHLKSPWGKTITGLTKSDGTVLVH